MHEKNPAIYMDHAAATPIDDAVLDAMRPYFSERFYNPSATYLAARAVAADIQDARRRVAHWLGAKPNEITFTAGGTEANNLAIRGIMDGYPGGNVVVSSIEHDAVLEPAKRYHDHKVVAVKPDGVIDLEALKRAIDSKTVLVSVMYANNEIGTIQPLKQIAGLVKNIRSNRRRDGSEIPLYFHTDACQAAQYLDLHVASLGVDMMTLNGGKIYGPKQSGALYVRTGVTLSPLVMGGGQERNLRSGTENVSGIVGFSVALDLVQTRRQEESRRMLGLQRLFFELLLRHIPQSTINGSVKHRLPNNMHVTISDQDNERLMMALDEKGIICAVGSACSAGGQEPSHVLEAIGLSNKAARASLRFSMGKDTDERMVHRTVEALAEVIE